MLKIFPTTQVACNFINHNYNNTKENLKAVFEYNPWNKSYGNHKNTIANVIEGNKHTRNNEITIHRGSK